MRVLGTIGLIEQYECRLEFPVGLWGVRVTVSLPTPMISQWNI